MHNLSDSDIYQADRLSITKGIELKDYADLLEYIKEHVPGKNNYRIDL